MIRERHAPPPPALRPQDVAVALQLVLTPGAPFRALAEATGLSQGEVHNAVGRLASARLVRLDARAPLRAALTEFLESGVPYAFAAHAGAETRGVATAHGAPSVAAEFPDAEPLVWPDPKGRIRGAAVAPLLPAAARLPDTNPSLYDLLALVDVLRLGRTRERQRARRVLREALAAADDAATAR
jgi:DNA-binding Lrp family transcriptional regulator